MAPPAGSMPSDPVFRRKTGRHAALQRGSTARKRQEKSGNRHLPRAKSPAADGACTCIRHRSGRSRRSAVSEKDQADRHYGHSRHDAVNGEMVFTVLFGGRQQLVKRDEDHDAGHNAEKAPQQRRREERQKNRIGQQCPDRFRQTRRKRQQEAFYRLLLQPGQA